MQTDTPDRHDGPLPRPGDDPDLEAPASAGSRLESFRRYTYYSMLSAIVVLLFLPVVVGTIPRPPDALGTLALLATLVVLAALVLLIEEHIPRAPVAHPVSTRGRAWLIIVGAAASLVAAATSVQAGEQLLWAFPPAIAASLVVASLPRRRIRVAVVATVVLAIAVGAVLDATRPTDAGSFAVTGAVMTVVAQGLTLTSIWTWRVAVELDEARTRAASLAVANERLRFAADLHDIQGHHLQVIALKSELAARLVRDDPDTAAREIGEVQHLAADALRDTRAVVQGYRRTTLDAEIANATAVLRSAGIETQLRVASELRIDQLPQHIQHLLGLVVREAITNVLRHSHATRADITLSGNLDVHLAIANDGAADAPVTSSGGLDDLAQRLRAAGGALTWQRHDGGFVARAKLPATAPDPTSERATEGARVGEADGR